ncbi:MAG TPA: glutamate synthase [Candidatus Eisenbacteria bacterium]
MTGALRPQPFAVLLARMLAELERERAIFDLPRRSFWRGREDLDLGVDGPGGRASNPCGPAAGPHTQLAQNIVIAWLAGARHLELKTVQVRDRIEVPRPCIDAPNVGYNVEWSQELSLEESLDQYVAAWALIHVLATRRVNGGPPAQQDTRFDASVGYDLEGIRSGAVARFLDGLGDAGRRIAALRDGLPPALRGAAAVEIPARVSACVTLSTFHGCPPDEIERIAEHLFARHGVHVVLKLNPTLLGHDAVEELLRGRMGYDELRLDRGAFDADLGWEAALGLLDRLSAAAARAGRILGVKLTNTLVVMNHRGRLPGERVYLSGPPLHVLAMTLADRLAHASGGNIPLSFSAGIDAENFADAVACGMSPVTACTDLLRPTGYRRLPRYLKALEADIVRVGARTVAGYVLARAGAAPRAGGAPDPGAVRAAALANLAAYARALPAVPRYHAAGNREEPRRLPSRLALFDCDSCNACVVVCPNDACFALDLGARAEETLELAWVGGAIERRPARFGLGRDTQWAVFADLCNECGNCDTFCPEAGGPFRVKPRFHGTRAGFEAAAPADGWLIESGGDRVLARIAGVPYRLERAGDRERFGDGVIEAELDPAGRLLAARALEPREGHVLALARYRAMRLVRDAILAGVNPVSAPLLVAPPESPARARGGG